MNLDLNAPDNLSIDDVRRLIASASDDTHTCGNGCGRNKYPRKGRPFRRATRSWYRWKIPVQHELRNSCSLFSSSSPSERHNRAQLNERTTLRFNRILAHCAQLNLSDESDSRSSDLGCSAKVVSVPGAVSVVSSTSKE